MIKIPENKILEELYELREGEIEQLYKKSKEKQSNSLKTDNAERKLKEFIKNFVKDDKYMEELCSKLNDFECCVANEMCAWNKPYYMQGFADGISLLKQIKEETVMNCSNENSIIHQNMNEIAWIFEEEKYKNLKEKEEYKEISKKISSIKEKFPKVKSFLEDNEIAEYTKEEMKAISDVIKLYDDRAMYESDEMLKIGLKEGMIL